MKIKQLLSSALLLLMVPQAMAVTVQWTCSTATDPWHPGGAVQLSAFSPEEVNDVIITRYREQRMLGFGGCFGELGWDALSKLGNDGRRQVMQQLFDPEQGADLSFCRTPIGANDFARNYYSLDDRDGDLAMKHFSIKRDKRGLIPYIKAALQVNPHLVLWACPWTPPTWMKTNHHYATKAGGGNGYTGSDMRHGDDQFIMQDSYLRAYANYFSKYLSAYRREGINIAMVMMQNEPYTINIWPNCSWSAQGMARFVGNYLGPVLERDHPGVKLWHGTMNTANFDEVRHVVAHPKAGHYIAGIGLQWEGREIAAQLHRQWPDMALMCTENECGDGSNDWVAAERTFASIRHYIGAGAGSYMYFNMVLAQGATSSWGWKQNSLVVVDTDRRTATYTPEYYVMRHFARHVRPNAYKLKTMGNDQSMLAFRNPDGSTAVVVANTADSDRPLSIALNDEVIRATLPARSFNTFVIN